MKKPIITLIVILLEFIWLTPVIVEFSHTHHEWWFGPLVLTLLGAVIGLTYLAGMWWDGVFDD